jgi:hypothetical protein
MRAHAQAVAGARGDVLNVGFGMGLVDAAIQVQRRTAQNSLLSVMPHNNLLSTMPPRGDAHLCHTWLEVLCRSSMQPIAGAVAPQSHHHRGAPRGARPHAGGRCAHRCRPTLSGSAPTKCGVEADGSRLLGVAAHHEAPAAHVSLGACAAGWDKKPGVRIVFGRWQDVLPQLRTYDGIFFDTCAMPRRP